MRFLLGLSAVLLAASVAHAQDFSDRYKTGDPLGTGFFKTVYEVEGHPELALGVLKEDKAKDTLANEKKLLEEIAKLGIPTAKILEIGTYRGEVAYLQRRFATGDRAPDWGKVGALVLNETSLADLDAIEKAVTAAKVDIMDAQVLVARNGHVVVNDPLALGPEDGPSQIKDVIKKVRARAEVAIEARKVRALLAGMPGARDEKLSEQFGVATLSVPREEADKAKVREALLHYLELGPTTDAARAVAKAVRDGALAIELESSFVDTANPKGLAVNVAQPFPKVAADLVRAGQEKLAAGASRYETRVKAAAHALAFLAEKKAPAGLSNDPFVGMGSDPAKLVRLIGIMHPDPGEGTREQLEKAAGAILARERGVAREASRTTGMTGLLDERTRERARPAEAATRGR